MGEKRNVTNKMYCENRMWQMQWDKCNGTYAIWKMKSQKHGDKCNVIEAMW